MRTSESCCSSNVSPYFFLQIDSIHKISEILSEIFGSVEISTKSREPNFSECNTKANTMTPQLEQLIFESIVSDVEHGIIAIDSSFEVIIANRAAQKNTQCIFSKQLQRGMNLQKEFGLDPMFEIWKAVLANKKSFKQEITNHAHSETYFISYSPLMDNQNSVIGVFAVIEKRDVSERFKTLMDASQTVMWFANQATNFVEHQAQWESFTGQTWLQHREKGWIDAFHPDDRSQLLQHFETHQQMKSIFQLNLRLWNKQDNNYWNVSFKAIPRMDLDGNIVEWIGSCLDTHQVTTLERKLSETKRDFDVLADCIPELVWTTQPDGHLDYWNHKFSEYTGLTASQAVGWGWNVVIHPDCWEETKQKWTHAINTGSKYEVKYKIKRFDGTYRWHIGRAEPLKSPEGKILKWFGTCTDIDDYESKLLSVTERLDITLKSAHIGFWDWDLTTKILTVDDTLLEMFDILPENFHNTAEDLFACIHKEDLARVEVDVATTLKDKELYDTEFRIGTTGRWFASRGRVFRNSSGEAIRMTGVNWDITTKRKLEEEKWSALQLAEEQGRKRVQEAEVHRRRLEEFIDIICHEIRNPLNGISGMASLMESLLEPIKDNNNNDSEVLNKLRDCLATIERCAEQQKVIVDDVLDLSKVENDKLELNPTPFNPKSLLETLQRIFEAQITAKHLKYIVEVAPEANNYFKADSRRLSQILINVQANSVKFTETGFVRTTVCKEIKDNWTYLRFCVSDTGIGMTADEVGKLFTKFYQANPTIGSQYGGSGLGLVISKKLVELMGGTFEVKSQKGVGSQFEFTIHCEEVEGSDDLHSHKRVTTSPSSSWNLASKRILIVEDNAINQKILNNYLLQQDCLCKLAGNGLEAVNLCNENQFDVIFMDLEMPLMGGLEATKIIRQSQSMNQSVPIIGLSGNARKEHMEEAFRAGMNDYLTKPYHKEDIFNAVAKHSVNESKKRKLE